MKRWPRRWPQNLPLTDLQQRAGREFPLRKFKRFCMIGLTRQNNLNEPNHSPKRTIGHIKCFKWVASPQTYQSALLSKLSYQCQTLFLNWSAFSPTRAFYSSAPMTCPNCDSKRDFLQSLTSLISESRHKQMHHTLARVIPAVRRAFRYQLSATQQKTPTQTRLTSLPVAIANPAKDLFPVPWSHFNRYSLNWRRTKTKRKWTNAANY
jgi:hypothetical protein